jgi:hypothetical protein
VRHAYYASQLCGDTTPPFIKMGLHGNFSATSRIDLKIRWPRSHAAEPETSVGIPEVSRWFSKRERNFTSPSSIGSRMTGCTYAIVGRVRGYVGGEARVRVRRTSSQTHQFLLGRPSDLQLIECPAGWMSPTGYRRYLRPTLAKLRARLRKQRRRSSALNSDHPTQSPGTVRVVGTRCQVLSLGPPDRGG